MNTNQLKLFKAENGCVPLLLYYLSWQNHVKNQIALFQGKVGEATSQNE